MMVSSPAFGLYIHWPFCQSKCPYCDFNSHVRERIDEDAWTAALLQELRYVGKQTKGRHLETVFFGGGTPSLMAPATVAKILDALAENWSLSSELEITLEGNPGSIEANKYQDFKTAGINRVSIGIQSLQDEALKFLGRLHSAAEAKKALQIASDIFDRVSFDLIYALPGQTVSAWKAQLEEALKLAKGHLSLYQLTIEPGTKFYHQYNRGDFVLPDAEEAAALYQETSRVLAEQNYAAYEVSNYAMPGHECQHNLIYWTYQDYACVGPGAHGRLKIGPNRYEIKNYKAPETWLAKVQEQGHGQEILEVLNQKDQLREHLLMNLRLADGVSQQAFQKQHGVPLDQALDLPKVEMLVQEGFLNLNEERLQATPQGILHLNEVLAQVVL